MDEREDSDAEAWLQLKPVEPLPSQCCGSGCSPCVFDLYYRDLERWEAARARNDQSLLSGKQSSETQVRSPEFQYLSGPALLCACPGKTLTRQW